MIKSVEKLYAYMGGKTEKELQLDSEREQYIKEMDREKKQVLNMVKSEGWKLLGKYLDNRIKSIHLQMERKCGPKKLTRLQNEIKVIKGIFGFLNSKIVQNFDN